MLYCVVRNSVYCDISKEGKAGRSATYEQLKMKVLRSLEMSGYIKLHITQFHIPEGQYLSWRDLYNNHPVTVKP